MKALLKNYHQSPRKVRLVADLIRGKSIPAARAALMYLPKKSSPAISKLLDSAIANARQSGASVEELFVKTITVDKGSVLQRMKPMARGRSARIHKTMSIINLELGMLAKAIKPAKVARAKKVKATAKPASAKASADK